MSTSSLKELEALKQKYAKLEHENVKINKQYSNLMVRCAEAEEKYTLCDICESNYLCEGEVVIIYGQCACFKMWHEGLEVCRYCAEKFEAGDYDKKTIRTEFENDRYTHREYTHEDYSCSCINDFKDCIFCNILANSDSPLCEFCGINKSFTGNLKICGCIHDACYEGDTPIRICVTCVNYPHLDCTKLLEHPRIDKCRKQVHHGMIADYADESDDDYECDCDCKFCSVFKK